MSAVIQYIIVGLILTAATGYVSYCVWRLLQGKANGRCSGCSACPLSKSKADARLELTGRSASDSQSHAAGGDPLSDVSGDDSERGSTAW